MKIDPAAVNRMTIRYLLENWSTLPKEQQEDIINAVNAHACPPEPDMASNPNCVRGLPKDLCTGCEQCAILDAIE